MKFKLQILFLFFYSLQIFAVSNELPPNLIAISHEMWRSNFQNLLAAEKIRPNFLRLIQLEDLENQSNQETNFNTILDLTLNPTEIKKLLAKYSKSTASDIVLNPEVFSDISTYNLHAALLIMKADSYMEASNLTTLAFRNNHTISIALFKAFLLIESVRQEGIKVMSSEISDALSDINSALKLNPEDQKKLSHFFLPAFLNATDAASAFKLSKNTSLLAEYLTNSSEISIYRKDLKHAGFWETELANKYPQYKEIQSTFIEQLNRGIFKQATPKKPSLPILSNIVFSKDPETLPRIDYMIELIREHKITRINSSKIINQILHDFNTGNKFRKIFYLELISNPFVKINRDFTRHYIDNYDESVFNNNQLLNKRITTLVEHFLTQETDPKYIILGLETLLALRPAPGQELIIANFLNHPNLRIAETAAKILIATKPSDVKVLNAIYARADKKNPSHIELLDSIKTIVNPAACDQLIAKISKGIIGRQ